MTSDTFTYPILVALHRVGPYHHARFLAAAEYLKAPLIILQTRPNSQEYPWDISLCDLPYTLISLKSSKKYPEEDPPPDQLNSQLFEILQRYKPQIIFTVGWADRSYLNLYQLCLTKNIPIGLISDSRADDMPRNPIKEYIKSVILSGYSSAIVAGSQSRLYLRSLGFDDDLIFQPWDVVDNKAFISSSTSNHKNVSPSLRPFLCVGRFIEEKNYPLLLESYALYQSLGGSRSLLIVGSGPLEHTVESLISTLPDPSAVTVMPFVQMSQLLDIYRNSHSLILASLKDTWGLVVNEAIASGIPVLVSNKCGCVPDLVENRVTGYTFPVGKPSALSECLFEVEALDSKSKQTMIEKAKLRLNDFSPQSFAHGLEQACEAAISNPEKPAPFQIFISSVILKVKS